MTRLAYLFLLPLLWGCESDRSSVPEKPNILLIVADDFGYTDLSAFGGDIETPNLDGLISEGVTFTRFQTAPFCAVTRAMMLSGNDNHIAGMGSQDLKTDVFGYEGHLTDRIIPIPALLREAGYSTNIAGKWHLGNQPEHDPTLKGFDYSFVNLEGGGNHYSSRGIFPGTPVSKYTEHGGDATWPEGAYSTDLFTNKIISYIDSARIQNKPFFSFAAYTTPHWPLQVDPEYWKKYEGQYDDGYDVLRMKRFNKMKELNLIPDEAELPEQHRRVTPWDSLSREEQQIEARKMELYAGMVDNMDMNIGRIIDHLKETGKYDNTLVVFFSDNGAAAEDFYHHPYFGPFLKEHYTEAYDKMGTEESFISYGPQWAEAGASPFKYFKGYTTQGGVSAPLVISGPAVEARGELSHAFTTLMDIAPTFYELVGIKYPEMFNNQPVHPLKGSSMVPMLRNTESRIHDNDYVFALEHRGYVLVRKGKWKLVNIDVPFDEENLSLFDLSVDFAEQKDLKQQFPDVYEDLLREWYSYRDDVGVVIPTPDPGKGL
jgi:arylsulfatase